MTSLAGVDKGALVRRLEDDLAHQLEEAEGRQQQSAADATHSEARAEHSKDTRATETSYLARGLAQRVEEIRESLARLRTLQIADLPPDSAVAVGALVALRDAAGRASLTFLLPTAGGSRLAAGEREVQVVTPGSPLGRALLGLCEGEVAEVARAGRREEIEVLEVR